MTAALLTIDEAATTLGVTQRFIRRLVAERRIRLYKIGTHVRFTATDLETFIANAAVQPVGLRERQGLTGVRSQ